MSVLMVCIFVCVTAVCALLNRFRGGGFGAAKLAGHPRFYVTPAIGIVSLFVTSWQIAAIIALGYLFWSFFSWSHQLASLAKGKIIIDREKNSLDKLLPDGRVGVFVRMMFALPTALAVCAYLWYYDAVNYWYLLAPIIFALVSTGFYTYFLQPSNLEDDSWPNGEYATGAAWGAVMVCPTYLLPLFAFY